MYVQASFTISCWSFKSQTNLEIYTAIVEEKEPHTQWPSWMDQVFPDDVDTVMTLKQFIRDQHNN